MLVENLLSGSLGVDEYGGVIMGAHYSMAAAKRQLGIDFNKMRDLCERDFVENSSFERADGTISRRLLDAARIREIAAALDQTTHHWEFWKEFRMPSYAVEQLICLGVIQGITDPAILTLRHEAMVPNGELERIALAIEKRARRGPYPASARSLRVLSHEIGGRLKPWGAIWQALMTGALPFWIKNGGRSTQHILVEPLAWASFCGMSFDRHVFPNFPFKTFMNNSDLSEVLNLQPKETIRIREARLIEPKAFKLTLRYEVTQVLDLAFRYISMTELLRRSGQSRTVILQKLKRRNVSSQSCLWERSAAEAAVLAVSEG